MWGATALVLRLHHPLKHDKEFVSVSSGEEEPHTAYQEEHVQSHEVSTSPYALQVRLYEIRKMELPLRGRDGDEQVGVGAEPYLPEESPYVNILLFVVLLVVAADQHDAHKIRKGVLDHLPIS